MKLKERKEYLNILELGDKASTDDIRAAYKYLVEMYSNEYSPELEPLIGDFSDSERKEVIELITNAYKKLSDEEISKDDFEAEVEPQIINFETDRDLDEQNSMEMVKEKQPEEKSNDVSYDANIEISGEFLKKKREESGLKVRDAGELLSVNYKDISYIENEKFEKMKDPGYLRWLIKSYSKLLGIDEQKGAEDYMKRYRSKK